MHGAADAGAQSSLESVTGVGRGELTKGRSAERGELVLKALSDAADHAREERVGEHLALLGDQPPPHAHLTGLVEDRALDLDLERGAVMAHAGGALGAGGGRFA